MLRPTLVALAVAALVVTAAPAVAGGPSRARGPATSRSCAPAAIADIRLPFPVPVDEIRVVVAGGAPTSAARVRVVAGEFDRVVRVGDASHRLSFYPALTSAEFRVSLDPILSADSPCVERIELRQGGTRVATVVP